MTGTLFPLRTADLDLARDTGQAAGRSLSVAELQQALRAARAADRPGQPPTRPAAAPHPTGYPDPSTPPPDTADLSPDDPDHDDIFAVNPVDVAFNPVDDGPAPTPGPQRPWLTGRVPARRRPALVHRRSRGARILRKILGLDRKPRPNDSVREPTKLLADLESEAAVAHPEPVPPGGDQSAGPAPARPGRGERRAPIDDPDPDIQVSRAPRGLSAVCWRWLLRILLVVVLLAGINQLFIQPWRGPGAPTTAPARLDPAAAGQAAARYAADYLTFPPTSNPPVAPILAGDLTSRADPGGQLWMGNDSVRADLVQPGRVITVDPQHSLVSVTARITLAAPPASAARTSANPSNPAALLAGATPVPAGRSGLGSRWLNLLVPVQLVGATVKVSSGGAVLTGEPGAAVPPIPDGQVDTSTTEATRGAATAFFTAYANSSVSYLAAPGVTLTGLGAAVRFVSLTDWTVTTPTTPAIAAGTAGAPTSGVGVGTVTWQLAGTDLQITQHYSLALTNSQHRWYTAAVNPAPTPAEG